MSKSRQIKKKKQMLPPLLLPINSPTLALPPLSQPSDATLAEAFSDLSVAPTCAPKRERDGAGGDEKMQTLARASVESTIKQFVTEFEAAFQRVKAIGDEMEKVPASERVNVVTQLLVKKLHDDLDKLFSGTLSEFRSELRQSAAKIREQKQVILAKSEKDKDAKRLGRPRLAPEERARMKALYELITSKEGKAQIEQIERLETKLWELSHEVPRLVNELDKLFIGPLGEFRRELRQSKAELLRQKEVIRNKGEQNKAARRLGEPELPQDERTRLTKLYALIEAQIEQIDKLETKVWELLRDALLLIELLSQKPYNTDQVGDARWQTVVNFFEMQENYGDNTYTKAFDLWCVPYRAGARVYGPRWLQDLQFQRELLGLANKHKVPQPTTSASRYVNQAITLTWDLQFREADASNSLLIAPQILFALAVDIAARRTRVWLNNRSIAATPSSREAEDEPRVIGWDIPLQLEENQWAVEGLCRIANPDSPEMQKLLPSAYGWSVTKRASYISSATARRLLSGQHSRKLGLLIAPGETGARGLTAKNLCIEFGLSGQYCSDMSTLLQDVKQLFPEGLSLMSDSIINLTANKERSKLVEFKNGTAKVALVGWHQHARVLFKLDDAPYHAIVDPWKPAEKVKKPSSFEDVFGGKTMWVERQPEQCGEGSCFLVATMRGFAIAIQAGLGGTSEDLIRVAKEHPNEGRAPLCAAIAMVCHYLVNTRSRTYPKMEVFRDKAPNFTDMDKSERAEIMKLNS
jgi:hypothetical protein